MAGRGKYHELLMATTAKAVNAIMEGDVLSDMELRTEAKRWGPAVGHACTCQQWGHACTCQQWGTPAHASSGARLHMPGLACLASVKQSVSCETAPVQALRRPYTASAAGT